MEYVKCCGKCCDDLQQIFMNLKLIARGCFDIRSRFFSGEPASTCDNTNPDWAPTLNLGHDDIGAISSAVDRNARAQSRKRRQEIADMEAEMAVQSAESSQTEIIQVIIQDEPTNSKIIDIISDFIACVLTHTYILQNLSLYIFFEFGSV